MHVHARSTAIRTVPKTDVTEPYRYRIHTVPEESIPSLLDQVYDRLKNDHADPDALAESMDTMVLALQSGKHSLNEQEWNECVKACRRHALKDLLHEDPFTRRAFMRPRGYPGDAVLLDYVYGCEEDWPQPSASPLGRHIFRYTTSSPAPEGVRARRGFMANVLDELADKTYRPHVLSIAAGHLREAGLSAAARRRKLGRFLALDTDSDSLAEVDRCYSRIGVETVPANVRKLLTNKLDLGRFDLVYSMGLLDYLSHATASRLLSVMFQMLNSGGRLVVGNFLPEIRDVGYMEVFMDWNLVYRTRQQMMEITMEIPQEQIFTITFFAEENQNIIFLEIVKN
jgi:extracellular factor (EF) 3-hydroxypalmitic acid methyl ester biosynthesis protein